MCTAHPSGFRVAVLIFPSSVPGLTWPLTALPSQFMTTSRSLSCNLLGPHVPTQDPFKGYPSCAIAGAVDAKDATNTVNMRMVARTRKTPFGPTGYLLTDTLTRGTFATSSKPPRLGSGRAHPI